MAHKDREGIRNDTQAAVESDSPFAGYETEHIFIEDVFADSDEEPRTVTKRMRIKNRARGLITELTFYAEGFLRVREGSSTKLSKDHTLELRFVDPAPDVQRHLATGWLTGAAVGGLLAVLAYLLLPATGAAAYGFAVATALATAAIVALLQALYRSDLTVKFVTASGRAEVLQLVGCVGCMRRVRQAARAIRQAIAAAGGESGVFDVRYLRAEMQAHYRLRENGVISQEECSDGTAQILARFG